MSQLENLIHDFQGLLVNHFGKYEPSGFCTEKFHAFCRFGDDVRRYGNVKMRDVGLYENRHVVFNEGYRRTSRRRDNCIEGVRRVDERSILGKLMNSGSYYAASCNPHKKGDSGLVNYKNGETVFLSEFIRLLTHVKKEVDHYKDEILKNTN